MRDRDGRLVLAQWPNPALAVWLLAAVLGWTGALGVTLSAAVSGLGRGALVVWALDELVRGVNPFRRVLGAVVLTGQLASVLVRTS